MEARDRRTNERSLILVGAGPVGLAAVRAAREDLGVPVTAVVDPNREARDDASRSLGARGYASVADLSSDRGSTAVVAFSSRVDAVTPVVVELLERLACNVVTTCEELADPAEETLLRVDDLCRAVNRTVVTTGANPGFAMDRLPLLLASACRNIRRVRVTRRLDTSTRRAPLVAKTGRGLSVEEFRSAVRVGTVGHVGLEASARLLADGLGWDVGTCDMTTEPVTDQEGDVIGQRQLLALRDSRQRAIDFELVMAWGIHDPIDRIEIDGAVGLVVEVEGGYPGDEGTAARVVSAIRHVHQLQPGFYRPTDLPLHV